MKIGIVLQLLKIVVQSHNRKTYICSNSDNAQQEFKKIILSPNIAAPNAMQQGYQNRDLQTLSSILRKL